ncbi:probable cyclin-dependent serine/threonine-protein kinase DDB_G0292550 [Rhagoletis pomonella]|uniref:probable cyclin-dependent serine/threonine-protein kinase DDB_G0292550 n=1 Tax=Rhagoletis pomonella TaxID=28610 RepID=UPI00178735B6|nr:probable cyclin-dependent serine/threonine-protein kinase DDB_G0292550 [Rhagoletis pomonella]
MATPEQKKSFISLCASIIMENYNGDPLSLASFIDKITLIEELSDESLTTTFIAFLKSKLEALKVHNNNFSDFAKQVEELADSLERSLIIEGMTQAKAHEMAVEQTINVCRLNSLSYMKSILASSTFSDSKDVVAKMIVEHDNIIKERQVLAFRSRPIRANNFRGGYRGSNNYRYHNNNFRFNGNSSRHSGNTSYRNNNQNRNNSFSNRRNNYNNSNNSQASSSRNNNHTRSNTRNSANVRTLNAEAPQARTLGELDLNN